MVNGKFAARIFQRIFCPETRFGEDGFPEYARPEDGRTYKNAKGHILDNCNVVPTIPFVCQ